MRVGHFVGPGEVAHWGFLHSCLVQLLHQKVLLRHCYACVYFDGNVRLNLVGFSRVNVDCCRLE